LQLISLDHRQLAFDTANRLMKRANEGFQPISEFEKYVSSIYLKLQKTALGVPKSAWI
jgi:hypothetical protein